MNEQGFVIRFIIKVQLCMLISFVMNAKVYAELDEPINFSDISSSTIKILNVDNFTSKNWEEVNFNGLTHYQVETHNQKNALKAESKQSASGLLFKKEIDLSKTPYLNWSWRLEKGLPELPETTKAGDDYAARIYIIHSGGWFFWQTKALNYVWSSRNVKGQSWPNAYAPDNALMKAVRDNSDVSGIWLSEKRHVQKDFKVWLGEDISQIEGVAIMTDTDDSKGHAVVYYGDIFFSAN